MKEKNWENCNIQHLAWKTRISAVQCLVQILFFKILNQCESINPNSTKGLFQSNISISLIFEDAEIVNLNIYIYANFPIFCFILISRVYINRKIFFSINAKQDVNHSYIANMCQKENVCNVL